MNVAEVRHDTVRCSWFDLNVPYENCRNLIVVKKIITVVSLFVLPVGFVNTLIMVLHSSNIIQVLES
jgi:hypothetical protein